MVVQILRKNGLPHLKWLKQKIASRQVQEGLSLAWNARDSLLKQKEFMQQHVLASYDTVMAYRKQFL